MKKIHDVLERIIDFLAITIVIESFLRFIGLSTIEFVTMRLFDYVFIVVLALDLFYRWYLVDFKFSFIKESWLELISLIPNMPALRLFRIFRIIKKSKIKNFFKFVHEMLKNNGLYYVIFIVIILAIFGGGILFRVEEGAIENVNDAIWLAFVTMTTVGYGDFAPTTDGGRLVAIILMIIGIGFLSVLTGSIASFFTHRRKQLQRKEDMVDIGFLSDDDKKMVHSYIEFLKSKE